MDLAALAGLAPAGVICEIMNDDGTMARVPDLARFAAEHGLRMITVADLIRYRLEHETLVERVPLEVPPTETSAAYLRAKRDKLGHLLNPV